jgi:hypothetical protein
MVTAFLRTACVALFLAAAVIFTTGTAAGALSEDPYWAVLPGVGIGGARLGMTRLQVDRALAEIPCPDWAFVADFDGGRLVRIATACGGAVRLESGVQVGSAFPRVIRQFGQPDPTLIVEDGRYDGAIAYWIPYPAAGIAFRVVEYQGDVTVQSIRVMPGVIAVAGP